jgi:mono/diheme cytochrome c family protein
MFNIKKQTMKKLLSSVIVLSILASCSPDKPSEQASEPAANKSAVESVVDPAKGIGQIKNVTLESPLDQERVGRGKSVYDMKCSACHRLDETRVVGPGWKDVTKRRKPEWIMNMVLNVDVMLEQDAEAQKLLELCLTRMPNQNVSIGDARDILEYMRQNDGEK